MIEFATSHRIDDRRTLNQFIARQGKDSALGKACDRVIRTTDTLKKTRDRSSRTQLANKIDVADINAEFERGSGDECTEFAGLQSLFCDKPLFASETAVMCGDVFVANSFAKMTSYSFGESPRINEDESGVVLANQFGESIVDFIPYLSGHDCLKWCVRQLDGQIKLALVTAVDDRAVGTSSCVDVFRANQEARNFFDWTLSSGKADANQATTDC